MKKFLFYFCSIFICFKAFSLNVSDVDIVSQIADILIEEYDNYKDKSFTERLVLKLGKRAFIDSVRNWQKNYDCLDTMPIKLHNQLNKMAVICEDNLDEATATEFRTLLTDLTRIGYRNLDIYYRAVKKLINNNLGGILTANITLPIIDNAVADLEFYEEKVKMYDDEQKIKNRIRQIMKLKQVKSKMGFYSFAFEFLDKIRVKVIAEDLKKMEKNLSEKKCQIN